MNHITYKKILEDQIIAYCCYMPFCNEVEQTKILKEVNRLRGIVNEIKDKPNYLTRKTLQTRVIIIESFL